MLIGFSFIRNGIKYDYPFRESLQSLAALCDHVYLAVGKSEDDTLAAVKQLHLTNVTIIETIWNDSLRESGLVLSEQTNIALNAAREKHPGQWAIYLQADEVLHESDFAQIRHDCQNAPASCDALAFRYLHFWLRYDQLAFAKKWYPQEIRAIKLTPGISSFGDAQSFQGHAHAGHSDARIFHYGHVRDQDAYERKKNDFHRLWHDDEKLQSVIAESKKNDAQEPSLRYLGTHPRFMSQKVPPQTRTKEVLLLGEPAFFAEGFADRICADSITWTMNEHEYHAYGGLKADLRPEGFLQRLFGLKTPVKMLSKNARPWSNEFRAVLKLSAAGIFTE